MHLVFKNAKTFKGIIDAISVLVDQGEFIVTGEGVTLRAADQAMIAMVDFSLPESAFKSYKVDGATKLGLDLDALSKVRSRARPEDELELELSEDNATLNISFKGKAKRNFTLPLLDISSSELPVPKIEFDAKATVLADILQDGLKDAALFNTYVTLAAEDKTFRMQAKGTSGNLKFELGDKDDSLVDLNVKGKASAAFSLDYLQDITKSANKEAHISLAFKTNAPVMISYKIEEAALKYFVAPRAEAD